MGSESGVDDAVAPPADIERLAAALDTENIAFVDTLNETIADLVEHSPRLDYEFICGDISDFGVSANGHGHFDIVHDGSSVHCVVFASRLSRLEDDIESGTRVAVHGDLSYYESEGSVSLLVDRVVPVGDGTYQQTYRENRAALADEGYLDADAKQSLPEFPTTVGIATSADSDARTDAVTSIHDRHPGVDIVVQDTSVQGDGAVLSLMDAVSALDADPEIDVIAVTRGGGADKHLRVFNEPPLCRVIHETTAPVVVGVGHENDRTLAGDVADHRVMTPTDVGSVVPDKSELAEEVATLGTDLGTAYRRTVRDRLDTYETELTSAHEQHVTDELRSLSARLDRAYETLEQERVYEREKADAIASYRTTTRRQRIVIAVLGVLLLVAVGFILITL